MIDSQAYPVWCSRHGGGVLISLQRSLPVMLGSWRLELPHLARPPVRQTPVVPCGLTPWHTYREINSQGMYCGALRGGLGSDNAIAAHDLYPHHSDGYLSNCHIQCCWQLERRKSLITENSRDSSGNQVGFSYKKSLEFLCISSFILYW